MSIYIVRHGNTFLSNEMPRRVGIKTDLPLVESGIKQAHALGYYFSKHNISFDYLYCSNLLRTKETAKIIATYQSVNLEIMINELFDEIDHGIDENKTEEEIVNRIGQKSIDNWDKFGIVPEGWVVNSNQRLDGWRHFFQQKVTGKNVLVVTSNGSARFSLLALGHRNNLNDFKLRTGSFGVLKMNEVNSYVVVCWNQIPI
jgi:broad specificity phosphatase PhoE